MTREDEEAATLLDIYRLHADLGEQAAASREGMNKLYTGMVSSIIAASVLLQRVAPESEAMWVLPALGVVVSLSWLLSIHSATGRLSAKHTVLVKLEARLPFDFLTQENAEFDKGGFVRRKWSSVLMPLLFLVICAGWLGTLLAKVCGSTG